MRNTNKSVEEQTKSRKVSQFKKFSNNLWKHFFDALQGIL